VPSTADKPKLTHLIRADGFAGTERALVNFIAGTADIYEHCIISSSQISPEFEARVPASVPILSLENPYPDSEHAATQRDITQVLEKKQPNLMMSWMQHCHQFGTVASEQLRIPTVWYEHDIRVISGNPSLVNKENFRRNAQASHSKPNKVLFCSQTSLDAHVNAGFNADNAEAVPMGVDRAQFSPDVQKRHALRQQLGVADDDMVIGSVTRYNDQKDFPAFAECATRLLQKCAAEGAKPPQFMLCGFDMDASNAELTCALEETGLRPYVHLLGLQQDMQAVYSAMDINFLPSQHEVSPFAAIEGIACGVPFVGTDVCETKKIAGDTGVVLPPRNGVPPQKWQGASDFADALFGMMQTVSHPQHRETLQTALAQQAGNYDIAAYTAQLSAIVDAELSRGYAPLVTGRAK
jgi:glycosyltransferase involved in cell wall biosynthesis